MPDGSLIAFHDLARETEDFAAAVLEGLSRDQKAIPCRFLYDARGSALFNDICDTPEYYPTRTELKILSDAAPEIARLMGPGVQLVELGSGSSRKIRLLLELMQNPAGYVAIDISGDHLHEAAAELAAQHPKIPVTAICGDYMRLQDLPKKLTGDYAKRVLFFPGSTIGNLELEDAEALLRGCADIAGPGGDFLIGVDLQKDTGVLNAAYDDAAGVTAAFTLNLLVRMNRELSANFDLSGFVHRAFYNPAKERVEIYIESRQDQSAHVAGKEFFLQAGERIHTEYSYKYSIGGFHALARKAGWSVMQSWQDTNRLFSVHYLRQPG